jgi:hypothetical protein
VSKDNIIKLIQPGNVDDQLTEILRNGARALLAQAVEAEVADFLGKHADLKTADGHQRVVRHGHLPEREVMTGIGPVAVRQPRVRDREADATDPDRIRFSPSILPFAASIAMTASRALRKCVSGRLYCSLTGALGVVESRATNGLRGASSVLIGMPDRIGSLPLARGLNNLPIGPERQQHTGDWKDEDAQPNEGVRHPVPRRALYHRPPQFTKYFQHGAPARPAVPWHRRLEFPERGE